jgi:hypothetical protein
MRIIFDVFDLFPRLLQGLEWNEVTFYRTIEDFVRMRLRPLEDEIDQEESKNPGRKIVVYILEQRKGPFGFFGYSESLTAKIVSCFSKKDIDYLEACIMKALMKG